MKATLYTLPSKQLLVYTDDKGRVVDVEHPLTEARGRQLAQARGIETMQFEYSLKKIFGIETKKSSAG